MITFWFARCQYSINECIRLAIFPAVALRDCVGSLLGPLAQQYDPVNLTFFRNSTCFMWFWFGLEILRLVYKKEFFKILNGFYLGPFYPPKK